MTNKEILEKLREDMELRNFSVYTKSNYESIAKIVISLSSLNLFKYITNTSLKFYDITIW